MDGTIGTPLLYGKIRRVNNAFEVLTMSLMRSPFARHNVMLSSSTVFMFSIHKASIGPSNTVHLTVVRGGKKGGEYSIIR